MSASITALCRHCGLPVRAGSHVPAEEVYCCYGCEITHHLLGDPGDEASARLALIKLGAGVLLGINVMMFSMPLYVESLGSFFRQGFGADSFFDLLKWLLMALSLPVYFLLGMPFLESSLRNIRDGLKADANLLVAMGVTAALLVSIFNTVFASGPVYYETAVGILVIITTGRYVEAKSRARATRQVEGLEKNIPQTVTRISGGRESVVPVSSVGAGDLLVVRPGDVIPVDCLIREGRANINEAMLSGEAAPVMKTAGDELLAGSINYDGALTLEVLHSAKESYIARLGTLLQESKLGRARVQVLADRISKIAVPIIIAVAIGSLAYWWVAAGFRQGLFAALAVVLVACPCALGIATPAALWIAVSEASKRGILFRSLEALERLASVRTIFFDKTGTLTAGAPKLLEFTVNSKQYAVDSKQYAVGSMQDGYDLLPTADCLLPTESHLLEMIREVASYSNHPLSRALASALPKNGYRPGDVTGFLEIPSQGIQATIDGLEVKIGSRNLTSGVQAGAVSSKQFTVDSKQDGYDLLPTAEVPTATSETATSVWCSVMRGDGKTARSLELAAVLFNFEDAVRPEAVRTIRQLNELGYRTMILSGDQPTVAEKLGRDLGTVGIGGLSPLDKTEFVRSHPGSAFIGDGLNDAGAIGAAQIGIAMGHGSDLVRSGADVIVFDRELERIPQTLTLAKRTMHIVKQNLFWAFAYNVIGVALAAMGILNPIIAALAMALSSLAVTQNSMRLTGSFSEKEVADG